MTFSLTRHPDTTPATATSAFTLHTSLFCALISLYSAAIYYLLRFGLSENSPFPVLLVLGIGLFVLLLSDNLQRLSRYLGLGLEPYWYCHYSILVLGSLLVFFLLGLLAPGLGYPLMLLIALAGYIFFCFSLKAFLRTIQPLPLLAFLFSCLIFSIWLSSLCWAFMLKPIFFESIVASSSKLWLTDTLYNVSMAQMIKTYHIPSTGMDGLPYMKYHFGSHWLLAMLSKLLRMHMLEVYNLAYPVIFPPLVFQAFFCFIAEVRAWLWKQAKDAPPTFLFWFLLLGIFLGFTKNLIAGNPIKDFMGGDLLFFSESYVMSIFFLFAVLALLLHFFRNQSWYAKRDLLFFYLILLPLLLSVTGFMKVSTMYIMAAIIGYLFVRMGLYRKPLYVTSLLLLFCSFILTYYTVVDFTYTEGGFDWFYFFRVQEVPLLKFFVYMYLWSYVFIALFFFSQRLYSWQGIKRSVASYQTLAAEVILVTVLAGLLPVSLLVLFVGNALYFTELNIFLAGALLLAYLPLFSQLLEKVQASLGKRVYVLLSAFVILWSVVVWQYNAGAYLIAVIGGNIIDRKTLVNDATTEDAIRQGVIESIAGLDIKNLQRILEPYGRPVQAALDSSTVYHLLNGLRNLDTVSLAEKRKSLIFFDPGTVDTTWQVKCHDLPFIVPVLSGMASLNGRLYNDCSWNGGYGFDSYPMKDPAERGKVYTAEELCAQVKARGFVYLYTYEPDKKTFVKTVCSP